jgi:hypothetical protein
VNDDTADVSQRSSQRAAVRRGRATDAAPRFGKCPLSYPLDTISHDPRPESPDRTASLDSRTLARSRYQSGGASTARLGDRPARFNFYRLRVILPRSASWPESGSISISSALEC